MKRKKLLYLVIGIFLFLGTTKVEAKTIKTYTNYKEGDEITVHLNSSEDAKFYIIKNDEKEVTAIYKGKLGEQVELQSFDTCIFNESNIYKELSNRTSNWTNLEKITLPSASEIIGSFDELSWVSFRSKISELGGNGTGNSIQLNSQFAPFYTLNLNDSFWTSSVASIESLVEFKNGVVDTEYNCNIYYYGKYLLNEGTYLLNSWKGLSNYIRPVITVSKDYVVGGYTEKEDIAYSRWEKLVEKIKSSDPLEEYNDNYQKDFVSDENSMIITLTNQEESYIIKYTYNNGIVTFDLANNTTIENAFLSKEYTLQFFKSISEIFGYNYDSLINWYVEHSELTLEKDGFQYTTKIFQENISEEESNTTIKIVDHFDFNLETGIITFPNNNQSTDTTKINETVEVPDTSMNKSTLVVIIAVGFILVGIGIFYIQLRKKKITKNTV